MDFSAIWLKFIDKKNWIGLVISILIFIGLTLWGAFMTAKSQVEDQYEKQLTKADSTERDLRAQIQTLNENRIKDKQEAIRERDERIKKLEERFEPVQAYLEENRKADSVLKQKSRRNSSQSKINNSQSKVINRELDKVIP